MAIEKLYLTDTFRVWAEKFNATIDASNTATANAEEAINKANEAIEKAENAAPKKHDSPNNIYGLGSNLNYGHMRGDGITTNGVDGEVIVKDIAIGGNTSDLASTRGQIGKDYLLPDGGDLNDLRTPGNYGVRGATWSNVPEEAYARVQVINGAVQSSGFVGGLTQLWCTIGRTHVHWFYRSFISNTQTWSDWVKFVDATDLATTSTPGIVQPDNTTITVKDGVISAKAIETIKDIPVFNNDFNNLTDSGVYFIPTTQGITQNSPIDITAYWWVKVTAIDLDDYKNILQEARLHSTDSGGAAYSLARCKGEIWGPWEYAYTQFAG